MFLAMCGSIATVAGAGVIIYKIIQGIKKPDMERDRHMREQETKLENCNNRLVCVDGGMAVLMKSTLAIMNHLIDGGHQEELEKAKEEYDNISRHFEEIVEGSSDIIFNDILINSHT